MSPQRLLEIFPGFLTWFTLLFPVVFSLFAPELVAIFFILYISLWFYRSLEFSFKLIQAYLTSQKYLKKDWSRYYQYFTEDNAPLFAAQKTTSDPKTKRELETIHQQIINLKTTNQYKTFAQIKHIIIIATFKESVAVLKETINAVKNSNFDLKKIILVLATEERDRDQALQNSQILTSEYQQVFGDFFTFMHPQNLPGEVRGKGGNITYSGKKVAAILAERNEDFSNIIVTTLDADNKVHPDYIANLTFNYLLTSNRKKKSYQPLPLFYNNIWDVPILNRMVAISSSFWHLFESFRPDRLRNFSSHAQSLEALVEMDFWNVKTIVEDGHQFWRAFFCYRGDHQVIPLFIPIYQDAVLNYSYCRSLICQYKQLRRWAWGASDIPFVITGMWEMRKELPWGHSLLQLLRLIEGHFMWATAPIIITLATPIPRMVNAEFQQTVLGNNLAYVLSNIFTYAMAGIFVSMIISLLMLPKPPKGAWYRISSIIQWIFVPISTIFFGSIPAIDSQTRLMLGKYMDFNVTEKVRKNRFAADCVVIN